MASPPEEDTPDSEVIDRLDAMAPEAKTLQPRVPQLKVPIRDKVPRMPLHPMSVEGRMPDATRADVIATAYRAAVRHHFGIESKTLRFGDITRSKYYPMLIKAADVCIDHGISPGAWAEWYMEKEQKRGVKRPPFITVVFSPKVLTKWRGWFRRAYDGPKGWKPLFKRVHLEQECRIKEVRRLNRGFTPESALHSLPEWYGKLREDEIAAGHSDPNDLYPKA